MNTNKGRGITLMKAGCAIMFLGIMLAGLLSAVSFIIFGLG